MSRKITQKELDQGLVEDLVLQSEKGVPNGVPMLDGTSKIPIAQIPVIGLNNIASGAVNNSNLNSDVKVGSLASLETTSKSSITDAINEVSNRTGSLSSLNTTEKSNLVASINELFTFANDGKTRWSSVIGSPLLSSDTFAQMQSKTQTIKNTLATNLTAKGQSSVGTETLTALVNKVSNVDTGKKFATGTVTATSNGTISLSGLTFAPTIVMVRNNNALGFLTTATNQIYADSTYNMRGSYVRYGSTIPKPFMVGTGYNDTLTSTGFTCRIEEVANQTLNYTAIG